MAMTWNVVNHTGEAFEFVSDKVRKKIDKLAGVLGRFPQDAVHLQVIVGDEPKRKSFTVSLNLRIPSNVLHVSKESRSLVQALDMAVRSLLLSLEKHRSKRREAHHLRRLRRKGEPRAAEFSALPLEEGAQPQSREDMIQRVLEEDYERLLRFVTRQIHEHVVAGTVPAGAIDARDVVGMVAEEAIKHPRLKPRTMDYATWCASLAFRQTRAAVQGFLEESEQTIPIDLDMEPDADDRLPEDLDAEEFALNVLQDVVEPEEATLADYIVDASARPLDVTDAEKDMVEALRQYVRGWPKVDREIFEMHYLEGLSAADIAVAMQCATEDIVRSLDRIQNTLRRRWLQIIDSP